MEAAQLVLEYLRVLAWPLTVLVSLLLFREQLRALFLRLRKADLPGGVMLDFHQELQEAKSLSQQINLHLKSKFNDINLLADPRESGSVPITEANTHLLSVGLRPSPSGLDMSYYRALAKQDPNVALAGLRMELEAMVHNLAIRFRLSVDEKESAGRLLTRLRYGEMINSQQYELAQALLRLCDAGVHGTRVSLDEVNSVIGVASVLRGQYLSLLGLRFADSS